MDEFLIGAEIPVERRKELGQEMKKIVDSITSGTICKDNDEILYSLTVLYHMCKGLVDLRIKEIM